MEKQAWIGTGMMVTGLLGIVFVVGGWLREIEPSTLIVGLFILIVSGSLLIHER